MTAEGAAPLSSPLGLLRKCLRKRKKEKNTARRHKETLEVLDVFIVIHIFTLIVMMVLWLHAFNVQIHQTVYVKYHSSFTHQLYLSKVKKEREKERKYFCSTLFTSFEEGARL